MRIALTVDPEIPVPPLQYGGIERIVDMLARGLVNRGHNVALFANPDSISAGSLTAWPGGSSVSLIDSLRNAATLTRAISGGRFDIVHSFSRIGYLTPILPIAVPKIMSYQRAISPRSVRLGHILSRGTLSFTAISRWMMRPVSHIGHWRMIPNGVPLERYTFRQEVGADAPLVFLGRIEEIKGPHLAIEIARRTGRRLIIAGNIPQDKQAWARTHVLAHTDGDRIRYVGPVDDVQKNVLLGDAYAFLMPILWEEPFGIVMAEALACGTPVLGLNRGAVPEVVMDGISGYVRNDIDGLVAAADNVGQLSRVGCRAHVEAHFAADPIVSAYEAFYMSEIQRVRKRASS